MHNHQRTALRFSVYIRAMGGDPISFKHGSHREWALHLQRQHERLRRSVDPAFAKAAKARARDLIRKKGYRKAAEQAMALQVSPWAGEDASATVGADQEIATAVVQTNTPPSEAGHKGWKLAIIQCRRKLRHENYWTAVQHALHLGRDVRTYLCPVCEGIHCGNSPGSELTRQYRRARKRWRVIERRLVSLDAEWAALVREKKVLLRQLGNGDVVALVLSELMAHVQRMVRIVGLFR